MLQFLHNPILPSELKLLNFGNVPPTIGIILLFVLFVSLLDATLVAVADCRKNHTALRSNLTRAFKIWPISLAYAAEYTICSLLMFLFSAAIIIAILAFSTGNDPGVSVNVMLTWLGFILALATAGCTALARRRHAFR
ncbi:MAG: hypothetical protein AAGA58_18375 [Verrucomicrobiota bacterium]